MVISKSIGGKARAESLTPEKRSAIAKKAAQNRWSGKTIINTRPAYTTKTTSKKSSSDKKLPAHFDSVGVSGKILDLESLKLLLVSLNESTQQNLLDFLLLQKMNRKTSSVTERKINMWTDSLAVELGISLGKSDRIFPLPLIGAAKRLFKEAEELLIDLKMSDLNTTDTKVMYNVIARVLVVYAHSVSSKAGIPVNMKLVLQTTTPIHSLIDNHYPNYIQSGLMSVVLKSAKMGITKLEVDDD